MGLIMKEILTTYTSYNTWANIRIANLLQENNSLLDIEVKSSFKSLRKTVHHIWDAELVWLARLEQKPWTWPPTAQFKNPAITDFLKTSIGFGEFVSGKDEDFISSTIDFKDSKGNSYTKKCWEMVMHCMNHSTYHRGQVITICRELGIVTLPSTDLITFLRESK